MTADPVEHNRRAWDRRARDRAAFTRPLTERELEEAGGRIDPRARAFGLEGRAVLCLGAGGGRQGPLYARAGGVVTVVDVSEAQLELDRQVAAARGLHLRTRRASMEDLSGLGEASFDLVIQPVSTCYVPDVQRVYRQVARVLRPGGLYIAQHKQPASLQATVRRGPGGRYEIVEPYGRPGPLGQVAGSPHREAGTLEFLHTWEALLGGLCRAGFVVEDLTEPDHADTSAPPDAFGHRCRYLPPYVRVCARRIERPSGSAEAVPLILP